MANRIQDLILMLEEEIEQSPKQRLAGGNKRLVDCDRMLDLLGDLKVVVPEEVRVAQTVLLEQKALLRDAENQATELLARARVESERLIAQENILQEARSRGDQIIRDAEEKADALMQESRDYSQTVMEEVQRYLTRYIEMIDETREDIRRNYRGAPKRFYARGNEEKVSASKGEMTAENRTEKPEDQLAAKEKTPEVTQGTVTNRPPAEMPKRQTAILDEDILRRLE